MPTLYERKSSYRPLSDAQQNLSGRTHYVDDDTLRYFHARVLSTHVSHGGLIFTILESCAGDHANRTRVFRHVIFDIFGNVLDRPETETSFKSRAPAEKAMWRAIEALDAKAVTRAALASRRDSFDREMRELEERLAAPRSEAA